MPQFVTAKHAEQIEALQGLAVAARQTLLADADRVERYISRGNEFIEEEDLRQYGERNELPPDRLNPALAFLEETGRVLRLGE